MIQVSGRECQRHYWAEDSPQETATTTIPQEYAASGSTILVAAAEQRPCMVFVRGPSAEDIPAEEKNAIWGKYYWPVLRGPGASLSAGKSYVLSFEVSEEQLGYPENVVALTSRWPALWRQVEFDPTVWRGVFPLTHKRKVLFSKKIKIRTAEIPRWKPKITLERRMLEGEDA